MMPQWQIWHWWQRLREDREGPRYESPVQYLIRKRVHETSAGVRLALSKGWSR